MSLPNWFLDISDTNIEHFGISDIGISRKENQDFQEAQKIKDKFLFVVCDGMGGHKGGSTASELASKEILDSIKNNTQNDVFTSLTTSIDNANNIIFNRSVKDENLKGMGTTCVIFYIDKNLGYVAHVGDSRIYWIRQGKIKRLTQDHSYVQNLVNEGVITQEQAFKHPRSNILTKSIGVNLDLSPEVRKRPILLEENDILLLCSDGLHNTLTDAEILDCANSSKTAKEICEKLLKNAVESASDDNITVQCVKIKKLVSPFLTHQSQTTQTIPGFLVQKRVGIPDTEENKFLESLEQSENFVKIAEEKIEPKKETLEIPLAQEKTTPKPVLLEEKPKVIPKTENFILQKEQEKTTPKPVLVEEKEIKEAKTDKETEQVLEVLNLKQSIPYKDLEDSVSIKRLAFVNAFFVFGIIVTLVFWVKF
ncbi:Stp1/IreP family PP2C-type Ser/Thr phosphatase [bacterium]|nr:Stp1/IreP family PP2C-type Ser/Thr phosphatase [bacterium]